MDKDQVIGLLRKIPFLNGLEYEALGFIAQTAKAVHADADTVIFREGEQGDRMYLIIKGKVEVYTTSHGGYDTVLATLESSDVFGEMSLLDDLPRSASVKALEDTILLSISRIEFQQFLENNFPVAIKLLDTLSKKLRAVNEKLSARNSRGFFPEI